MTITGASAASASVHRMVPYGCLSTGDKIGMIEVVLHTQTLAKIQKVKGGGATGAFRNHILLDFLREHNPSGYVHLCGPLLRVLACPCMQTGCFAYSVKCRAHIEEGWM